VRSPQRGAFFCRADAPVHRAVIRDATDNSVFVPLQISGDSSTPPETNDTELLPEAWAALSSSSDELIRFHSESMPAIDGQPGHDEWERCGC
jgi:hypothetical protein